MKRMSGSSVNVLDVLLAVYSFYLAFLEENSSTKSKTSPNIIQNIYRLRNMLKKTHTSLYKTHLKSL